MKTLPYFLLLFALVCGCTSRNPDVSFREPVLAESEISTIRGVLMAQQDAWNAGSIEGYMNGYEKSDSLRFLSGGNITYGWKTLSERYKAGYADTASMGTLTFSDVVISPLSKTAALAYGRWSLAREGSNPGGMFTLIVEKGSDGWRVTHDHTSSAR